MFKLNKKVAAGLAAGAVVVAGSGVAYAYWTTTGTGTGSASASTSVANSVTINQDAAHALSGYVLGQTQDVYVTATNTATYSQSIGNITVVVADSTGTDGGTCTASNWLVSDVTDAIGMLGAHGSATDTSSSVKVATIQLKDLSTNQDHCKGASPVLTFSAAQGA